MATGGPPALGGVDPSRASFNVYSLDGTQVGFLGTSAAGALMQLTDQQGKSRVRLSVSADGTPHIEMLDAGGNVTWTAQ